VQGSRRAWLTDRKGVQRSELNDLFQLKGSGWPHLSNDLRRRSYFWRFLKNTSAFPAIYDEPIQSWRGTCFPSSSVTSYVTTICASKAFNSAIAKNRPGLSVWGGGHIRDANFTMRVGRVRKVDVWWM